jgi:SAM-dependent methyltransferase
MHIEKTQSLIGRLREQYRRQRFHPNWLGLFINPFYHSRKSLDRGFRTLAPHVHGRILDVGCGTKPYADYFDASAYVGLELASPTMSQSNRPDCLYDGHTFPFADAHFDAVITSEVLEHVFNPDQFLHELTRVLRPNGLLLLTVPFVWDEHEQPYDYGRYSSFGLKHLLNRHGLEILRHEKTLNDVRILFQLINVYIYKKTATKNPRLNTLIALLLMAPFNLAGELLSTFLPKNDDLFLDNIVLARKVV